MCGLSADAYGAANVRPGCPGSLRGCNGFVQPMAGLVLFARGCFHTEDSFRGGDVGFPLIVDGVFDLTGSVSESAGGNVFPDV